MKSFKRDFLDLGDDRWKKLHFARGTLEVDQSGLDSDDKRNAQQALELRQAGY